MSRLYWKPARTLRELDQAQKLRFACLSEELDIQLGSGLHVERDVSSIDCLDTTEHVLVYHDDVCVGTARVAFPNRDLARRSDTCFGLELENSLDLRCLAELSAQLAEVSRLFVRKRWHGTAAAARLYEGLYVLSRERGARYWVGGVDCKSSLRSEAELMFDVLARRGDASSRYRAPAAPRALNERQHDACAEARFYTQEQLELAEQGRESELPVAAALTAFTRRLGATCIGRPVRHPAFPRYVLPMLVDLEALPEATLRLFDRAQLASLPALSHPAAGSEERRLAS